MTPLSTFLHRQVGFLAEASIVIEPLVVGIFLHILITVLSETSKNHRFDIRKMSAVILGLVLAFFLY